MALKDSCLHLHLEKTCVLVSASELPFTHANVIAGSSLFYSYLFEEQGMNFAQSVFKPENTCYDLLEAQSEHVHVFI